VTFVYGDSFLPAVQFTTDSLVRSGQLIEWCKNHEPEILRRIHESSSYISVQDLSYDCVGTTVMVSIRAGTGDAMGSNMVSKAAGVLYDYIAAQSGLIEDAIVPYPEDKKYIPDRQKGKKVIARAVLKREILAGITRTSLEKLLAFITNYKNLLALHGAYSLNIHVANGMAALFQAFGQDMACLGECSQAIVDSHFTGRQRAGSSAMAPRTFCSLSRPTIHSAGTGYAAARASISSSSAPLSWCIWRRFQR
jgi:hydroxymethylglutaryl-CoA reductase (NADPH)